VKGSEEGGDVIGRGRDVEGSVEGNVEVVCVKEVPGGGRGDGRCSEVVL
jgi:hypothetical protein